MERTGRSFPISRGRWAAHLSSVTHGAAGASSGGDRAAAAAAAAAEADGASRSRASPRRRVQVVKDAHPCPELFRPLVRTHPLTGRKTYDNPWAPGATDKSLAELVRFFRSQRPALPTEEELARDLMPVQPEVRADVGATEDMRVTWISHATLLVQVAGLNILTDPALGPCAGPASRFGVKRFAPPILPVEALPRIDLVLLSHTHYDHLDALTARALGKKPLWIVPEGASGKVRSLGAGECVELSWWHFAQLGEGQSAVRITAVPAQHWTNRTPFDRNTSLWCGFVVEPVNNPEGKRFFFAGDTGYDATVFGQIGDRLGPFDVSAIPIGAYDPEWFMGPQHNTPEEALDIHSAVRSARSIAIHWGTFPLANDGHADSARRLVRARRERGMGDGEFEVLRHGESIVVGEPRSHPCRWAEEEPEE